MTQGIKIANDIGVGDVLLVCETLIQSGLILSCTDNITAILVDVN